jgi:hypothetical protein
LLLLEKKLKNCCIVIQKVAAVEASEICQSSFDHTLGASRHHNREREEI